MEDLTIVPQQWVFLGEGKAHIVVCRHEFQDQKSKCTTASFVAQYGFHPKYAVLRLAKIKDKNKDKTTAAPVLLSNDDNLMCTWFTPSYYPSSLPPLSLSSSFVVALVNHVHHHRPAGRRHVGVDHRSPVVGYVERNMSRIWKMMPSFIVPPSEPLAIPIHNTATPVMPVSSKNGFACCMSVEIKVKYNDVGWSPFIRPCNRIKLLHGRYDLTQRYKQVLGLKQQQQQHQQQQQPSDRPATTAEPSETANHRTNIWEWGDHDGSRSHYDPCDLISADEGRVRRALKALLETPQNNLKVVSTHYLEDEGGDSNDDDEDCTAADGASVSGMRHLYGCNKCDEHDKASLLGECDRFFGTSSNSNSGGRSLGGWSLGGGAEGSINGEAGVSFGECGGEARVVEALTAVLTAEDVLPRLRAMQRMDFVDVEGAAAVYAQLTRLLQLQQQQQQQQQQQRKQVTNPKNATAMHPSGVHVTVDTSLTTNHDEPLHDAPLHDTLLQDTPLPWRDTNEATAVLEFFDTLYAQHHHHHHQHQHRHPPLSSSQPPVPPLPPSGQPLTGSEWTAQVQGLVEKLWALRVDATTSAEDWLARRETAEGRVQAMTVAECVTVLRLWLLALAAKDCGVVVSIQPLPQSQPPLPRQSVQGGQERKEESCAGYCNEGSSSAGCGSGCVCRWEVLRLQTEQAAGLLRLTTHTPQYAHTHAQADSQAPSHAQVHAYVHSLDTAREGDSREKVGSIATAITNESTTPTPTTIAIASAIAITTATATATSTTTTFQHNHVTTTVCMFSYSVGLVDLGPKPLDKAVTKDANEDEFCAIAGTCITNDR